MSCSPRFRLRHVPGAVLLLLLAAPTVGRAAAPVLTFLYPAGAQQGKTVEVTAGGTFERWPVKVWVDRKGVEVKAGKDRGKLSITVAADAAPGLCWIRLFDEQGASGMRPFLIGTLAEVVEKEPNDEPAKAQRLPMLPVVVNGRLERAGDVDGFAVRLQKGETLVASVEANRTLGAPMDALVQVLSADGFVLEQNNDDHGLDPQIVFTAPREGTYLVRLFCFPAEPDTGIRFAGSPAHVYRLTLTNRGFADHPFPLAVTRGQATPVEVVGWNVPAAAKTLTVKQDVLGSVTLAHPQLAGTLQASVVPHACLAEKEPNDRSRPQEVTLPVTISGHIDRPGDSDVYRFQGKKGQEFVFEMEAGSAGSQLDPLLRLTDGAGQRLAQADDAAAGKVGSRDTRLSFTLPRDGAYCLEVRDQDGHGSFRHFYRLHALRPLPDYELTVARDQLVLTPGKPLGLPITIARRNGFRSDIAIHVEGLPAGVTAAPVKATGAAGSVTLSLQAKGGPVSTTIRIVGQVAGQADLTRLAKGAPPKGPRGPASLWLTVTK